MKTKYLLIYFIGATLMFGSCIGDLDVKPLDENVVTDDIAYADEASYFKALSKIYSVFAMSGQDGEGSTDIDGLDAGNAQLLRSWWNLQVITTDECKNAWGDNSWVKEVNELSWTNVQNESVEGVYQRCMFIVALTNEFLTQTTDSKLSGRGVSEQKKAEITGYRREARFVRALAYYILMDAYGRPPFITEDNYSMIPKQLETKGLFAWIETELKELATTLPASRTNEYGRADQGAANFLLARMYLNAETYTGQKKYTECITACNAVIAGGYSITPNYANIFKADNNITSASEIVFPICFDGAATKTWGGMTYLICSARGGKEVVLETDGVSAGWDGNRTTKTLVNKFEFADADYAEKKDASSILDKRGIFFTTGRSIEINSWDKTFTTEGWAVYKFSNIKSDGTTCMDTQFPETDFPMFRLADVYLMYAEAVLRGGTGGSASTALGYINELRERGYGDKSGNISSSEMTLDFILDERARELYWEGTRRTDLIRYGLFTTSTYVWPFKGGVKEGTAVEPYKNLFPIPVTDLSVNPSLTQNDGYQK